MEHCDECNRFDEAGRGPSEARSLGFPPLDGLDETISHLARRAKTLAKRKGGADHMVARNLGRIHDWLCELRKNRLRREGWDPSPFLDDECKRLHREDELLKSTMAQCRRLQEDNQKLRDEKAALSDVIADLRMDLKARE